MEGELPEPLTPKGNVLKIVELGLENRVFEAMKKPGFNVLSFTKQLNAEGIDISQASVRKFIMKSKEAQRELISKDLQALDQYKQTIVDYGGALKSIMQEVEEVKNQAREEKDYKLYEKLVGRLMQGIELVAKLSNDMRPTAENIDIKIVYREIDNATEKEMSYLRKRMFKDNTEIVDAEIVDNDEKLAKKT